MKNNLFTVLMITAFASNINVYADTNSGYCAQNYVVKLESNLKSAKQKLSIAQENEEMYAEISNDAKTESRIAVGVFTTSATILSGGMLSGLAGISGGVNTLPTVNALIGSNVVAAGIAVLSPIVFTIGGIGAGVISEFVIVDKIQDGDLTVDDLISANKNFDKAQEVLKREKEAVNLDYSKWTDFLGIRDRMTMSDLYINAQEVTEIEKMRVEHFEISLQALKDSCAQ